MGDEQPTVSDKARESIRSSADDMKRARATTADLFPGDKSVYLANLEGHLGGMTVGVLNALEWTEAQLHRAQQERDEAKAQFHRARDNAISANADKDEASEKRLEAEQERDELRRALAPFANAANHLLNVDDDGKGRRDVYWLERAKDLRLSQAFAPDYFDVARTALSPDQLEHQEPDDG